MEGATFLTRVVLEDYKSIAHCDVRLGPLNYLVGPNGSGKSNFLDALRFVADALNTSLAEAVRRRGGLGEIVRRGKDRVPRFRIKLSLLLPGEQTSVYDVQVGLQDGRTEVIEELCRIDPPGPAQGPAFYHLTAHGFHSPTQCLAPRLRDRLYLASAAGMADFRPAFEGLAGMHFYNISPSAFTRLATPSAEPFLAEDGGNITDVLERLGEGVDSAKGRIEEYLRIILPTLDTVTVEQAGPGRMLRFWQRLAGYDAPQPFWPAQMSAGTLRSLGILTALLQGNTVTGPRPSLVGIEEPEAQVNPALLVVLRDAMTEASYCTQVLVTTHSSDLLDNKDVRPEEVLAVSSEQGVTRIGPLDEGARDLIRQRLYTPGELLRIGQVFPADGVENAPVAAGGDGASAAEGPPGAPSGSDALSRG